MLLYNEVSTILVLSMRATKDVQLDGSVAGYEKYIPNACMPRSVVLKRVNNVDNSAG